MDYLKKHSANMATTLHMWCQRCQCNARFRRDILCVIGHPYNHPLPEAPTAGLTIQFKEFTYCNDRFVAESLDRKPTKYQLLININLNNKRMECSPHSWS